MPIALVHGGPINTIGGLRVTDAATLEVVREIIGRRVNPAIVSELVADVGRAEGVGGDEGVFIASPAHHTGGDLGVLGEVDRGETVPIVSVILRGAIPVISPIVPTRVA